MIDFTPLFFNNSLSNILRYSLNKDKTVVTVAEELNDKVEYDSRLLMIRDNGSCIEEKRLLEIRNTLEKGKKFLAYKEDIEAWGSELYAEKERKYNQIQVKAIPYHDWGNRGLGEMLVWIRKNEINDLYTEC